MAYTLKYDYASKKSDTSTKYGLNDDLFLLNKRFSPFGNDEEVSFNKASLISSIVRRQMSDYMRDFTTYFVNDSDSVRQCLNYLSIKPSNENSLLKADAAKVKSVYHQDPSMNDDQEFNLFSLENNPFNSRDSISTISSLSPFPTKNKINPEDIGIYESMIGSSELTNLSKMIDDELYGHYYKANNYQSFFLDVTKLLVTAPNLACDLLDAPQLVLTLLDHIIIPYLFTSIEALSIKNSESDPVKIMEMAKSLPEQVSESVGEDVQAHIQSSFVNRSSFIYDKINKDEEKRNMFTFQITTRLRNIPPTPDVLRKSVGDITDSDVGNLVIITATVVLAGVMSIIEEEREYVCKKCQKPFISKCSPESYLYTSQFKCPNYADGKFPKQRCDGTSFDKGQYFRRSDYQEIRCQSIFNSDCSISSMSVIPVVLRREIAGTCFPGDTVHISGFVRRRWYRLKIGERCETELYFDAVNIETVNWKSVSGLSNYLYFQANLYDNFWKFNRDNEVLSRAHIVGSICPELLNIDNAKLALILTLIGGFNNEGVNEESENRWDKYSKGSKGLQSKCEGFKNTKKGSRTQCHILFLGDPGTGKSHLLNYATRISYRHVSVIGTNCTSVGLTCTIVRDGPETMLAAGALVLASGGICCIDEFATIKADDKSCLHEAMEQQVISVAKAGMKCTLNCQCTIVAASNPKAEKPKRPSKVADSEDEMILNVETPLSLLTRFDLIIVFKDNASEDLSLSEFLLAESHNVESRKRDISTLDWSSDDTIKNYVQFVRENIFPTMPEACKRLIDAYYSKLRDLSFESDYAGGPTVRTVESLERLSQAHARLMFRTVVKIFDVVSVILIMEFGLGGYRVGCKNGAEQVVDRAGIFEDIRSLYKDFLNSNKSDSDGPVVNTEKMSNGITSRVMYDHFERLLFDKLGVERSLENPEEVVYIR